MQKSHESQNVQQTHTALQPSNINLSSSDKAKLIMNEIDYEWAVVQELRAQMKFCLLK